MTDTALDPGLAAAIELRTGPILETRPTRGFSSDYTGVIRTGDGDVFVKAVKETSRHVEALEREAAINPSVLHVSPELLWQAQGHGWRALGFEAVKGETANFKPDSDDLRDVVHAIELIGQTKVPEIAQGWAEHRWDRYTAKPGLFAGDTLLHTDVNPGNFLMESDNAAVVDWAWPGVGAGFIDAGCLVVQLIAAGWAPGDAEDWAAGCTGWQTANPAALDEFAAAQLTMHQRFEVRKPDELWLKEMTQAAWKWNAYRRGNRR